jgi:hypothetical protein
VRPAVVGPSGPNVSFLDVGDSELGGKEGGMAEIPTISPNPKRVAAGKRNRQLWRGHTPAGLERLRGCARRDRPWEHSTGPRTAAGKAKAAANGRARQKGLKSVREIRAEVAGLRDLLADMRAACQTVCAGR